MQEVIEKKVRKKYKDQLHEKIWFICSKNNHFVCTSSLVQIKKHRGHQIYNKPE